MPCSLLLFIYFIFILFFLTTVLNIDEITNDAKVLRQTIIIVGLIFLSLFTLWPAISLYDYLYIIRPEIEICCVTQKDNIQIIVVDDEPINLTRQCGRIFGNKVRVYKYPSTCYGIRWLINEYKIENIEDRSGDPC